MTSNIRLLGVFALLSWLQVAVVGASDQQIVYIRNTCECWSTDLKCVCKIESDPTSVRPLMQRLVNRTAEYYWQELEFQSMVYDRTTFILANTFADGPFPWGITFKGDFSIVNDSFNHLNMTLNKVELNFETFSGRKPKFSKQYWRYIFDHGEGTLRTLRIIKYQVEDFIIPNYLGAALTQEVRPLTEFKVVGCEVKEVKERAFKNFTQLEVLDLSDNHLTTLPENVFSRNINLQKILLANNQISFLTKTIFDGLPNLLLINLRKNKLTAVPAIPRHTNRRFQPMVYLMADNSIHCRCSLIWVLHELTFHHNLEIEATCSDPTMVRGMPIIEGFTRMDKEACYRLIRKEDAGQSDGPLALAGPSDGAAEAPAAEQMRLMGAQASQISPSPSPAPSSAEAAASHPQSMMSMLAGRKDPQEEQPSKTGSEPVSGEATNHAAESAVVNIAPRQEQADSQEAKVADSQQADSSSAFTSLLTARTSHQASQVAAAAAAAAAAAQANQIELQPQAVAPQTPVSGPDTASQSSSKQQAIMAAPASGQTNAQLLNVAQQTVLTPSQSDVVSPLAAADAQVGPVQPAAVVASSPQQPLQQQQQQQAVSPSHSAQEQQ